MPDLSESPNVYIGVLRATLVVPGARTLKDRRRVVRSVVDRLRARFPVSVHELPGPEHPGRQPIVVTTGGGDHAVVTRAIRSVQDFLETGRDSMVGALDVEVFGWHPPWERSAQDYADDPASDPSFDPPSSPWSDDA